MDTLVWNCLNKMAFPTHLDARRACEPGGPRHRQRQRDAGLRIEPYRCPLASHWHLGHAHPRPSAVPTIRERDVDLAPDWQDAPVEPSLLRRYAHRVAGYPILDLNMAV
jgi:hypothetical protein